MQRLITHPTGRNKSQQTCLTLSPIPLIQLPWRPFFSASFDCDGFEWVQMSGQLFFLAPESALLSACSTYSVQAFCSGTEVADAAGVGWLLQLYSRNRIFHVGTRESEDATTFKVNYFY